MSPGEPMTLRHVMYPGGASDIISCDVSRGIEVKLKLGGCAESGSVPPSRTEILDPSPNMHPTPPSLLRTLHRSTSLLWPDARWSTWIHCLVSRSDCLKGGIRRGSRSLFREVTPHVVVLVAVLRLSDFARPPGNTHPDQKIFGILRIRHSCLL